MYYYNNIIIFTMTISLKIEMIEIWMTWGESKCTQCTQMAIIPFKDNYCWECFHSANTPPYGECPCSKYLHSMECCMTYVFYKIKN